MPSSPPLTPSSTSHCTSSTTSSTARLLEELSLEIMNSVNTRTFETLRKYAAPDFIDSRELTAGVLVRHGSTTAINYMKKLARSVPNFAVEPRSIEADVDEDEGTACVWMTYDIVGRPQGYRGENVCQWHWRRGRDEVWLCTRYEGLSTVPRVVG